MTTFYEQRLDLGINYGATFGPRFNTAILTQSDGQEQRRALWSQPLIMAQLGDRRVTQSELNALLAFHATVKGAAIGFRLRDWSDYKATNQAIGTGNGTVQTWQLVKTYAISTATVTRPITKPVAGSVVVYVDGVEEETGWSVDTTTGVLTTELTGAIAVDFEFDVPVRFEQDKIDFTFEAKGLFTLAPLTCTEIRVEPTIYPTLDTLPGSLEEIIDLGYDFGTLGGPSFSTGIKANGAEFELRKSRWESSLGSWDIGDRLLIRSELDYLIRLFRVCRGMAIPFRFKDWQTNTVQDVRFAEDRISFRFEAYSEEEVIFNLGGMAVTAIAPTPPTPEYIDSLFSFDYGNPIELLGAEYPETINAPPLVVEYFQSGRTVTAYLISARYDNGFILVQSGETKIGVQFSDLPLAEPLLMGTGISIDVKTIQSASFTSNPCYFGGTIRWYID